MSLDSSPDSQAPSTTLSCNTDRDWFFPSHSFLPSSSKHFPRAPARRFSSPYQKRGAPAPSFQPFQTPPSSYSPSSDQNIVPNSNNTNYTTAHRHYPKYPAVRRRSGILATIINWKMVGWWDKSLVVVVVVELE